MPDTTAGRRYTGSMRPPFIGWHLREDLLERGITRSQNEGVSVREIAEAIGRGLKMPVAALSPEEAAGHFGWLAFLVSMDAPASSTLTQQRLGWHPAEKTGFLADLECSSAFGA